MKTDDNYVFKKFTLLVAISNSGCVGSKLYQQGGMTKERFVEFLEANIFNKYKNYLIILKLVDKLRSIVVFFLCVSFQIFSQQKPVIILEVGLIILINF